VVLYSAVYCDTQPPLVTSPLEMSLSPPKQASNVASSAVICCFNLVKSQLWKLLFLLR